MEYHHSIAFGFIYFLVKNVIVLNKIKLFTEMKKIIVVILSFFSLNSNSQNFSLIITEIFADPTPSKGLPEKEFIELYNPSSKLINLKGFSTAFFLVILLLINLVLFSPQLLRDRNQWRL